MKKIILLILLTFILSGCGSTSPTVKAVENPPKAAATAPQATVNPAQQAAPQATVAPQNPPAIDGAAILENQCAACHSSNRAKQAPRSKAQWEQTVSRMIDKGAQLSDAEKAALIDYLAANYGK